MQYEDIIYTKENQVARITINRPQNANMFRTKTLKEMKDALVEEAIEEGFDWFERGGARRMIKVLKYTGLTVIVLVGLAIAAAIATA